MAKRKCKVTDEMMAIHPCFHKGRKKRMGNRMLSL